MVFNRVRFPMQFRIKTHTMKKANVKAIAVLIGILSFFLTIELISLYLSSPNFARALANYFGI